MHLFLESSRLIDYLLAGELLVLGVFVSFSSMAFSFLFEDTGSVSLGELSFFICLFVCFPKSASLELALGEEVSRIW